MWNKKVLSLESNSDGVMDDDNGESTGEDEVADVERDELKLECLVRGCRREVTTNNSSMPLLAAALITVTACYMVSVIAC